MSRFEIGAGALHRRRTVMDGEVDDGLINCGRSGEKREIRYGHCTHQWTAEEGPQTDRAREMVKAFIARQLKS